MDWVVLMLLAGGLVFVPTVIVHGCAVAIVRHKTPLVKLSAAGSCGFLLSPVWAPVFGMDVVSLQGVAAFLALTGMSYAVLSGVRRDA